jgi:hypothetical protein
MSINKLNAKTERRIEMKGKITIVLVLLILGGLAIASSSRRSKDETGYQLHPETIQSNVPGKLNRNQREIWALRKLCGQLVIQVNLLQDRTVQIETILRSKGIEIPDSNTRFVKISRIWSNNPHETIEMHRIIKGREVIRTIVKGRDVTITKPLKK